MSERDPNATYPMGTVERLTGLTAATIRAWERRYDAIEPVRTDGNARRYTAENVRRLVLLRKATERGHSIAALAALDDGRLADLADAPARVELGATESSAETHRPSPLVEEYLALIDGFDVRPAMDALARAAAFLPARQLVFELVVPLVHEVGERWARGDLSIAHEHVVTSQLRWLLATLLRAATPAVGSVNVVVATPPGERHELGALIGAFLVASRGLTPIYLGTDLPYEEIARAADATSARIALLSLVANPDPDAGKLHSRGIRKLAKACEVWVGLSATHSLARSTLPARTFHAYDALDVALRVWRAV